jgi:uncharacterized protein (TIGR03118 family)
MAPSLFAFEETHNDSPKNHYIQERFVANKGGYKPKIQVDSRFINAWDIAIRPAGAGGHFWVTAKDISFEYVGDVKQTQDQKMQTLHQDDLKMIKLPIGGRDKFATSVVFNNSKDTFVITQSVKTASPITAPAKFLFASDGGIISAWTERKREDGKFDRPSVAKSVIDHSKEGAQFFGLTVNQSYTHLYAADFGKNPTVKVFDGAFNPLPIAFENPFITNGLFKPGDYAPFNVKSLIRPDGEERIFVTYAKTQVCSAEGIKKKECQAGELYVGEEDTSQPGHGRLVEFKPDGTPVAIWEDAGHLSAPWGLAFAPHNFGTLSGMLLVSNFGDGTIAAYNPNTRQFIDYMRDSEGNPIKIEKIWGILFGNGVSLGDSNALYFAAGPNDERDGLFGSLRPL